MFTGLIESTGRVERVEVTAAGRMIRIATPLAAELQVGESIAVSGVCLTVTVIEAGGTAFGMDVSPETLRVTTIGAVASGSAVNLERALRADARLGGHFVLGHVDGVGRITACRPDGDCLWIEVALPAGVRPYVIPRGSIAMDGVSLTMAAVDGDSVGVQIVPLTRARTTLGGLRPGDAVNLEADVIGKYVARLLAAREDS
jgi:riboflavin synthase